jgi:hypothetical protein
MNSTDESTLKQLHLMQYSEVLAKLDPRVRTTYIGAEQYVSILDILQYHGNKKNPTQSWRVTQEFMTRQGYSTPSVVYAFEGKDGKKKKPTPVVDLKTFFRIAQSADVPAWEPIRDWMAELAENESKSIAQRKRENEISKYKKAGYGDKPEVQRLEAYNEALKEYSELKSTYARICENPNWQELANAEYFALFGMFANQLKAVLKSDNIRKSLDTEQLDTMAFAERRLRSVLATQGDNLSNERIKQIIDTVISPLGVYLRGLAELRGVHHVTNQPLLATN